MNQNMTVEDLLIELSSWGIVELKYIHDAWFCEVRIPGYLGSNIGSYVKAKGSTPLLCLNEAWEKLEEWQASGKKEEDRKRYLEQHNMLQTRYDNASTEQRMGFNPIHPPAKLEPERPLKKERLQPVISKSGSSHYFKRKSGFSED